MNGSISNLRYISIRAIEVISQGAHYMATSVGKNRTFTIKQEM